MQRQTRPTQTSPALRRDNRQRAVIEDVTPCVDCGRFAIKRVVGEVVRVEADIFADGHDRVACSVLYRPAGQDEWREAPMSPVGPQRKDRWSAEFVVTELGPWEYTIEAWVDPFQTWTHDLEKRAAAGQDLRMEYLVGAPLVESAAQRARGAARDELLAAARTLRDESLGGQRVSIALAAQLASLMRQHGERKFAARLSSPLRITVDRPRARFSSWYELFPRSTSPEPGRHGTFRDVEARLPYVASMGFDVLYLPPIHPIGRAFRKGPNNRLDAGPSDVGSPWAIGAPEGGHTAIHPELGTLEDFDRLLAVAKQHNLEIALDIAYQCSPDHPYVRHHPEWFRKRPDGSIQYAENPPKKYQDIYPFDFETDAWESLWDELRDVVEFWAKRGVRIFRIDNPHTKAFAFWEWMIGEIKSRYPDTLFLSEAFTRRKVMYRLAKLGFTQSYTYFAWRNHAAGIEQYFTELTQSDVIEYFRPNAWPNTPDILTEYLQTGGREAFVIRAILAATLCANWGIYGPAFELMEHVPREPGSEEYRDSEKYQLRHWDLHRSDSLSGLVGTLNRIRRENVALQQDRTLRFHHSDNANVVCYSKTAGDNAIIVVASTDPHRAQNATVRLDLSALGLEADSSYELHDLLTGGRWTWHGAENLAILGRDVPAHVMALKSRFRSEGDFDYFY